MLKVPIAEENSTESLSCFVLCSGSNRSLLDLPYEIVFEIFRGLSKGKLIDISRLSLKCKDVAGDKRLWKDVTIKYQKRAFGSNDGPPHRSYAFEELYSEPWPVDVIDLTYTEIKPPVSSKIDQIVKVTKLDLSQIKANKVTMEAILAKYQCTELHLDYTTIDSKYHVMGIAPETFSKQTNLEVLSLCGIIFEGFHDNISSKRCDLWLAPILSNCKNLKALDLTGLEELSDSDMLGLVKQLPTSLVMLRLPDFTPVARSRNSFFSLLVKSTPNLRELELCPLMINHSALLKFKFLENLQLFPCHCPTFSELCTSLRKFPVLKTVCVDADEDLFFPEVNVSSLRSALEPHGIVVKITEDEYSLCPKDYSNLWEVF